MQQTPEEAFKPSVAGVLLRPAPSRFELAPIARDSPLIVKKAQGVQGLLVRDASALHHLVARQEAVSVLNDLEHPRAVALLAPGRETEGE
ncbi:hypothetical protein [Cupriavidus necator]|uniref:hypothetical protein n=1 Tax=Cupriavidus necator TaxID=106590 RepID=UPI0030F4233A